MAVGNNDAIYSQEKNVKDSYNSSNYFNDGNVNI